MRRFDKVLIANRGEIAVRVARTARRMGYRTVAVYSDADADSLHARIADEAVRIGPAPATESYLSIAAILQAAAQTGAQAIHPGYGFLSENADFARAVIEAGLVFIGPPVEAIRLMGSKRLAKIEMIKAGVPCIPGYEGGDQSDATLLAQAERIGCPLMVKAAAGGGGKGLRLVTEAAGTSEAIRAARSEGRNAFGSDELILERALLDPRHIEFQVFGDTHGNFIHLGERDCSVQRRHQKVIEEAPSPFLDPELRARMGEAAVAAARACAYVGAGTVEFLVDAERNFYFLEMNTRLQVEHPVTEEVTGFDLVELQLRVAAGEPLGVAQSDVQLRGHAIEARLYAEDPAEGFLPQTGPVLRWAAPTGPDVRVDHGIRAGQRIGAHYDPMLAKVIARGATRNDAIRVLGRALAETRLFGVRHNARFLRALVGHEAFRDGAVTTAFIDRYMQGDASLRSATPDARAMALAALVLGQGAGGRTFAGAPLRQRLTLRCGDTVIAASLTPQEDGTLVIEVVDQRFAMRLESLSADHFIYYEGDVRRRADHLFSDGELHLDLGNGANVFVDVTRARPVAASDIRHGMLVSPMDGAVVELCCAVGEAVRQGQVLAIVEAMKMQHRITAPGDGVVLAIGASVGAQVKRRQMLIELDVPG